MSRKHGSSLFDGSDDLVDKYLCLSNVPLTEPQRRKPPLWKKKVICNKLLPDPKIDIGSLLGEWLQHFNKTVRDAWPGAGPSKENWRFEPRTKISPSNNSSEVVLERALVCANDDRWANQVPVCSSYVGDNSDTRACIDLILKNGNSSFTFYELKWSSDNPFFAAIELLRYFAVYLFTRENFDRLGYAPLQQESLLSASAVHLRVLGPPEFYKNKKQKRLYDLAWLERTIDCAVRKFVIEKPQWPQETSFAFEKLPDDVEYNADANMLSTVPARISRVYSQPQIGEVQQL